MNRIYKCKVLLGFHFSSPSLFLTHSAFVLLDETKRRKNWSKDETKNNFHLAFFRSTTYRKPLSVLISFTSFLCFPLIYVFARSIFSLLKSYLMPSAFHRIAPDLFHESFPRVCSRWWRRRRKSEKKVSLPRKSPHDICASDSSSNRSANENIWETTLPDDIRGYNVIFFDSLTLSLSLTLTHSLYAFLPVHNDTSALFE